jgi:hypothetical protein
MLKVTDSCGSVGPMASVLVTSFVSLWISCTIPNWVRSGYFTLLMRHVCVGCAGPGPTETEHDARYVRNKKAHFMLISFVTL